MHKKLSLGLSLGFYGNLTFVIFALVCYIYYKSFDPASGFSKVLEVCAYLCLFAGFAMLAAADVLIIITTRMRTMLKTVFSLYIVMEAFMMYCELNSFKVLSFYDPYSVWLAIIHSVLSAAVCFCFLELDRYKNPFEVAVIICIGVILGGMFGTILHIRIYFGILANAISFTALFGVIRSMLNRNIIEIDCHGDAARVAEYNGIFETEPDTGDTSDKK
ncbi:MAG: hypothetical protein IJ487_01075 [Ruminococcus sp.]|nr:hypothetical protein [Ruminococcus sp.]